MRPTNERECFQCMNCSVEFVGPTDLSRGMAGLLAFPCHRKDCCICGKKACNWDWCYACRAIKKGLPCTEGACPKCGSKYVEWLSYDFPDKDIYLAVEWESGERCWIGSATVTYRGEDDNVEDTEKAETDAILPYDVDGSQRASSSRSPLP